MASVLLDSDAVIDYLKGVPNSVSLIQGLFDREDSICTCDIVVAEVYSGFSTTARSKAQYLFDALVYLSTPREAAAQAGEWRYQYARQGKALSTTDALIAAIAYIHSASIVTGNMADYPMSEVEIIELPRKIGRNE